MAHGSASVEIVRGGVVSVIPAQWECQRCTLLNSDHLHRCQVCESPRKMRLPTLSDVETNSTHAQSRSERVDSAVARQAHSDDIRNINSNSSISGMSLVNSTASTALDIADLQIEKHDDVIALHSMEEWQCLSCTFSCNPSFAKRCETCGSEKPSTLRVADLVQEEQRRDINVPNSMETSASDFWNCSKCTFENVKISVVCLMCGQVRSVSGAETWCCSHCTLENLSSDLVCNACQRPKNDHQGGSSGLIHPSSTLCDRANFMATLSKKSHYNGFQEGQNHLHESSLVEDIRKIEEKEANELRMAIINHCKTVCDFCCP